MISSSAHRAPVKPGNTSWAAPPARLGFLIALKSCNPRRGRALLLRGYTLLLFAFTVLRLLCSRAFASVRSRISQLTPARSACCRNSSSAFGGCAPPQFVLVWLSSFYIFIGIVDSVRMVGLADSLPPPHARTPASGFAELARRMVGRFGNGQDRAFLAPAKCVSRSARSCGSRRACSKASAGPHSQHLLRAGRGSPRCLRSGLDRSAAGARAPVNASPESSAARRAHGAYRLAQAAWTSRDKPTPYRRPRVPGFAGSRAN